MRLADQERECDLVVVMESRGGSAQASGCVAPTLGSRVGLHAPDATDLDGGFAAWREAGLPVVAPRVLRPGPAGVAPPRGAQLTDPR